MKRFFSAVFAFCLVLALLPGRAAAVGTKVCEVPEAGLSIALPATLALLRPDMSPDDPVFGQAGLNRESAEKILKQLKEFGQYLFAFNVYEKYAISISAEEVDYGEGYGLLSDNTLLAIGEARNETWEEGGYQVDPPSVHPHAQTKFLFFHNDIPEEQHCSLECKTQYNGKLIYYSIRQEATDEERELLLDVIDSIQFDEPQQLRDGQMPTDAFTYTEPLSGTSFQVPENWIMGKPGGNSYDVEFLSNTQADAHAFYQCSELWDDLSDAEKRKVSRAQYDNDFVDEAWIAENRFNGCTAQDVSRVTYNGIEYYKVQFDAEETVFDYYQVIMPNVFLMHIEDGRLYEFWYTGNTDEQSYADFESLVCSAVFPDIPNTGGRVLRFDLRDLLFVLGLLIVFMIPVLVYRFAVAKKGVSRRRAAAVMLVCGVLLLAAAAGLIFGLDASVPVAGAVLPWGVISFFVLTSGYCEETAPAPNTAPGMGQASAPAAPSHGSVFAASSQPGASVRQPVTPAPIGAQTSAPVAPPQVNVPVSAPQANEKPAEPAVKAAESAGNGAGTVTAEPAPASAPPAPPVLEETKAPESAQEEKTPEAETVTPPQGGAPMSAPQTEEKAEPATPPQGSAPVSAPQAAEKAEPAKTLPEIRFCAQCGAKLAPGSRFCTQCGAKIHVPSGD